MSVLSLFQSKRIENNKIFNNQCDYILTELKKDFLFSKLYGKFEIERKTTMFSIRLDINKRTVILSLTTSETLPFSVTTKIDAATLTSHPECLFDCYKGFLAEIVNCMYKEISNETPYR